jgi:membrane peptidoglycan carboxypeptidase
MNRTPSVVLAIVADVAAGATAVWLGNRSHPTTPNATASTAAAPKASEVYASDGSTLIVRFDGDPQARCLGLPTASWGYFCDYLVGWWRAQPAFGAGPAERLAKLRTGGYRITGSLDLGLQATALRQVESVATNNANKPTLSVATIAPGTGLIRALAVNQRHQPPTVAPDGTPTTLPSADAGATFMMFTTVAALEAGIPLDHTINTTRVYETRYPVARSDPQACGAQPHWCPVNAGDRRYLSGPRTAWDAFTHTVTTYYVALEETVGADKVVETAQRLGIRFIAEPDHQLGAKYARDWGAFTLGVSQTTAIDLANAYATLAADGLRCEPRPVQAITDARGSPVAGAGPNCRQAVTAEVARAAIDAGRCAVGDRSATGDVCGPGVVRASRVLAEAGRPVSGQLGTNNRGTSTTLVVTSPGLSTAGILTDPSGADHVTGIVQVVSRIHHDGLAGTPARTFPPPPESLARGHS